VTGEHQGGQARRSGSLGTTQDPGPGTDNERDRFYVLISTAYANGRRATLPETRGKAACSEVSWKHRDHQKRQSDIKPEYWVAVGADVSIPPLLWPASRRSMSDDPLRHRVTKQQGRPPKMRLSRCCGSILAVSMGQTKHWRCYLETPGQALPAT
jgi:hypothetical protein